MDQQVVYLFRLMQSILRELGWVAENSGEDDQDWNRLMLEARRVYDEIDKVLEDED